MYLPKHFASNVAAARALILSHPFATLITTHEGQVFATQIPLIFSAQHTLIGHMARANPHCQALSQANANLATTVLFSGPNAYVSPAWYAKNTGVPTWNYANVQVLGKINLLEGSAATEAVVKSLITHFDTRADEVKQVWADLPQAAQVAQLGAITAFEIQIESLQAKLKLSQNRPAGDQAQVQSHLAQGNAQEQAVAAMMLQINS